MRRLIGLVLVAVLGVVLAACASGSSSSPGGAKNGQPAPTQPPGLVLACQLGWDSAGTGFLTQAQATQFTKAGNAGLSPVVRVTADNTGSSLFMASAVAVNLYA